VLPEARGGAGRRADDVQRPGQDALAGDDLRAAPDDREDLPHAGAELDAVPQVEGGVGEDRRLLQGRGDVDHHRHLVARVEVGEVGRPGRVAERAGQQRAGVDDVAAVVLPAVIGADRIVEEPAQRLVRRQADLLGGLLLAHIDAGVGLGAGQQVPLVLGAQGADPEAHVGADVAQALAEDLAVGLGGHDVEVLGDLVGAVLDREPLVGRDGRVEERPLAGARHLVEVAQALVEVLVGEVGLDPVARPEAQADPLGAGHLPRADGIVQAADAVLVALVDDAGDAQAEHVVDQRQVHRALEGAPAEVGQVEVGIAAIGRKVRLAAADGDRARRRRDAAVGSLRPAQHLDLADVVERLEQEQRLHRRLVQVERDGRLGAGAHVEGDAAQRGRGLIAAAVLRQAEARHDRLDVLELLDVQLLQAVGGDDVLHQRRGLQALRPAPGGDDDLGQHRRRLAGGGSGRGRGRGRRLGRRGRGDRGDACAGECGRDEPLQPGLPLAAPAALPSA
jgi:hypothetical protein